MKIAIITDTHWGSHNNCRVHMDYYVRFYEEVFFPYLKQHDIKHVLHLGDYFDSPKNLNTYTVHTSRKKFISVLEEMGVTMDLLVGNHDFYYKTSKEIATVTEAIVSPNVTIVQDGPVIRNWDGYYAALYPWVTKDTVFPAGWEKVLSSGRLKRVFGHFEYNGFKMHKGGMDSFGGKELEEDFKAFPRDRIHSGHFHTKNGIISERPCNTHGPMLTIPSSFMCWTLKQIHLKPL